MASKKPRRRWLHWTRRIVVGLLILFLVLAGIAAFLVGTAPGGRIALSVAEGFLPEDMTADIESFDGRLIDRFELRGVTVRIPTNSNRSKIGRAHV